MVQASQPPLMRNHTMCGVYDEMSNQGFPAETIEAIKDSVDCNLYYFDNKVQLSAMYLVSELQSWFSFSFIF